MQFKPMTMNVSAFAIFALFMLVLPAFPAQAGGVGVPSIPPIPTVPLPPADFRAPNAPQDVQVSRAPDYIVSYEPGTPTLPAGIILGWQPPAPSGNAGLLANEVERIVTYNIYRGAASGLEVLFSSVGSSCYQDCQFYDDTCVHAVGCYYQVSAVNAVGEGNRSQEVFVSALWPATHLPTSKTARNDDGLEQGEVVVDDSGGSLSKDLSVPYDFPSNTYASDGAQSATLWMYGRSDSCVPGLATQTLRIQLNEGWWGGDQSVSFDPCLSFGPIDSWVPIDLPIDGSHYRYDGWSIRIYEMRFILEDGPGTASTTFGVDGAGELMWFVEFSPVPLPHVFAGSGRAAFVTDHFSCSSGIHAVMTTASSSAVTFELVMESNQQLTSECVTGTFGAGQLTGTRNTGFQGTMVLSMAPCTVYVGPFSADDPAYIYVDCSIVDVQPFHLVGHVDF